MQVARPVLPVLCLECGAAARTADGPQARRWLEGLEPLPCGHSEADFLPDTLMLEPVPLAAARSRLGA